MKVGTVKFGDYFEVDCACVCTGEQADVDLFLSTWRFDLDCPGEVYTGDGKWVGITHSIEWKWRWVRGIVWCSEDLSTRYIFAKYFLDVLAS
jgi:hypothetical protein